MLKASERKKALRAFKQRAIAVHVGALECLHDAYVKVTSTGLNPEGKSFGEFLDKAFDLLSRPDGARDGILTKSLAKTIADRLTRDTSATNAGILDSATAEDVENPSESSTDIRSNTEVIDVFKVPQWKPNTNGLLLSSSNNVPSKPIIDGCAKTKSELFRLRYQLHLSKALRNENFNKKSMSTAWKKKNTIYHLTGVESLLHEKENHDEKLVLGMLTQLEEGVWYLEDMHGSIKLDLSNMEITAGLHTDGSFIIAQGKVLGDGEKFKISVMGTPIHEPRERTIEYLGKDSNLFGGNGGMHYNNEMQLEMLLKKEQQLSNEIFLILSDVAVDSPRVLAGIRHLFQGYLADEVIPSVIIFMGGFLSHPFGQNVNDIQLVQQGFKQLGEVIKEEFPQIAKSSLFLIIPSTSDAGPGNILPRPPLPNMLVSPFIDIIGQDRVFSCTNPCRLRYLSQEIVIMRDNILQKMVRHCCVKPAFDQSKLLAEHLLKSFIDQAYLSPLPLSARPVLWAHHHALWLFPTPHVLISADKVDGFVCKYEGCLGLNPGSFSTDFSFQIYLPAERRAQQCSLNSEDIEPTQEQPEEKEKEKDDKFTVEDDSEKEEIATKPAVKKDVRTALQQQKLDFTRNRKPKEKQSNDKMEDDSSEGDDDDEEDVVINEENDIESDVEDDEPIEDDDDDEDVDEDEIEDDDDGAEGLEGDQDGSEVEDSDDDSLLVPAEGIKKIDIKSLVRSALAEDTSTIGQVGDNEEDEDGNESDRLAESDESIEAVEEGAT